MAEKIRPLFHFESKDFYVEFFRINEWADEKTTITVAKPLEDGGFTDQRSFTVDESRNGSCLTDRVFKSISRSVQIIPVICETGEHAGLSIDFRVRPDKGATYMSISLVDLDGNVVDKIVPPTTIVNDEKFIDNIMMLIGDNVPVFWEWGINLEPCESKTEKLLYGERLEEKSPAW